MYNAKIFFILLGVLASLILLPGCTQRGCLDPLSLNFDPEATEDDGSCSYPIPVLSFSTQVGDETFEEGKVFTIGGTAVQFSNISYYLSNPAVGADGVFTETDTTLYIKAGTTQSFELLPYEGNHMHMLRLSFGVDSLANYEEGDPSRFAVDDPLGPKSPNMYWNWNAGYIFFRIDGQVDTENDGVPNQAMEFHIGTQNFYQTDMMEIHTDALSESVPVNLTLDIVKLFENIDLATEYETHTGDNLPLAQKFGANIPAAFSKK